MKDREPNVLFDGYPRTQAQASQVEQIFDRLGMKLDAVIALQIEPEALIKRITARRTCAQCGRIFNLIMQPMSSDSICPACGGKLEQRDDDIEAVVRQRMDAYRAQTEPLLKYFASRGVLFPVDGLGSVEEVGSRIDRVVDKLDAHG